MIRLELTLSAVRVPVRVGVNMHYKLGLKSPHSILHNMRLNHNDVEIFSRH